MEDHDRNLSQPLLLSTPSSTATATSPPAAAINDDELFLSKSGIISRLLSVIFVGIISVWANYEASKGFGITIINDAKDSPAGKRFNLLYVSNDKATRIVMNTSSFVENVLHPNIGCHSKKKQVKHVTLRFANNRSYSNIVSVNKVNANGDHHQFVINMSPSIMDVDSKNGGADHSTFTSMVLRAMARVWLWDGGETGAPPWLLDGMVEYICELAGFRTATATTTRGNNIESGGDTGESGELDHYYCLGNKEPKVVAQFLDYCEKQSEGFIQRLNHALEVRWHNRTVEEALGMPVLQKLCDSNDKKYILDRYHDCSS